MVTILQGDCCDVLKTLPEKSVHCCVTSPPYWGLRDYGCEGQIGLEKSPEEYVAKMVEVFAQVWRVLRDDGTVFLNLGDSYFGGGRGGNPAESLYRKQATNAGSLVDATPVPAGCKPKDLVGIPWMVAFALRAHGWYLRQDIIWHKPNPMPESVTDRCTKAHEYIFLLSKSRDYYYDQDAIFEKAVYGEDHARKSTSWGPDGKMEKHGIGKGNRNNYTFKGDNHTCHKRKHDGTNHGGNGAGFQGHSGYDKLNDPYCRNKRSVWTVTTQPYTGAHFATFPPDLIRPCIMAGCPVGGTVLDPFFGSGTTGEVAEMEGRNTIGIELNPEYIELAKKRTAQQGLFCGATP